ncbi:MAG: hypothetical protein IPL46_05550 [Saprospiraceae bacterium]|nr:hypothetical protein [Saprospiraceae bacterium]
MNEFKPLITVALFLVLGLFSCNPDCNTSSNGNISIDSAPAILAGRENQILLRSIPANFLRGRQVFIDNEIPNGPPLQVDATFEPMLDGLIVTIPEDIAAVRTPNVYVDDPDCSANLLVVDPLLIRSEEFFFTSDAFIVPPIPIIIVPAPAVTPPISITNAWLTPYDRDYCMWFVPVKDANDKETSQLRVFKPGIEPDFGNDKTSGSREFIAPCADPSNRLNRHLNPISGVIDKAANFIEIQVDRTSKGLGIETFTGRFIEPVSIPDNGDWRNGGACKRGETVKSEFMLLTSQKTGQQLLLIKG